MFPIRYTPPQSGLTTTQSRTQPAAPRGESDEVKKAQEAAQKRSFASLGTQPTIFSKIIAREIPADIFYEDEKVKVEVGFPNT